MIIASFGRKNFSPSSCWLELSNTEIRCRCLKPFSVNIYFIHRRTLLALRILRTSAADVSSFKSVYTNHEMCAVLRLDYGDIVGDITPLVIPSHVAVKGLTGSSRAYKDDKDARIYKPRDSSPYWSIRTVLKPVRYFIEVQSLAAISKIILLFPVFPRTKSKISEKYGKGKDGWLLAKLFFAFLWTETKKRRKRTRPISSHHDRTGLVNKGFIILWPKYYTKEVSLFHFILPARRAGHIKYLVLEAVKRSLILGLSYLCSCLWNPKPTYKTLSMIP